MNSVEAELRQSAHNRADHFGPDAHKHTSQWRGADLIASRAAEIDRLAVYRCSGCGRLTNNPTRDLEDIRSRQGQVSCCPERDMRLLSAAEIITALSSGKRLLAEATGALEPFTSALERVDRGGPDEAGFIGAGLTLGDLRRARTTLSNIRGHNG